MSTSRTGTAKPARWAARRRPGIVAAAVLTGLLGSGAFVWQGTQAAFTATTGTPANAWSTGSVTLTDDDGAVAMFNVSGMKPGDTGQKCIKVTYGGSLNASGVKLYASLTDSTPSLGAQINLQVEESADGGSGTFANCTGFTGTSRYNGALSTFASTYTNYASGLGTWAPNGGTTSRVYRFTYTLSASAPDTVQGKTANATFTWEANS